jgi:2'-5' RNA ligase
MAAPGAAARRLFVALAPDAATRARLAGAAGALRAALGPAARDLRFAGPASLHLTLRFLGEVGEGRLAAVGRAVRRAASGATPLALEVRGAGALPDPRRPRAVYLGVEGDLAGLGALAAGLEAALAAAGFPPEPRPWHPHLTVARPRGRRRPAGLAEGLAGAAPPAVPWTAREITLFESHLGAGGARHEPLLVAPLGVSAESGRSHP